MFIDPSDASSSSLAADFSQQFKADRNNIIVTENYTVGSLGQGKLPGLLQDALSHNPDLINFFRYANDISVLLANLPISGPFAKLQILGGDALHELGGYSGSARAGFNRLHFTFFVYPARMSRISQASLHRSLSFYRLCQRVQPGSTPFFSLK